MVAVSSDEDLTCAFYFFALPPAWQKYQALNTAITGADLRGVPNMPRHLLREPMLYPIVAFIAMGWSTA
eukprot:12928965-Prorocentrum_lima.AAC.1